MQINNDEYGGFIVSKNILAGKRVKYTFREESMIPQLNGWNMYSEEDDQEYVSDPSNFTLLNAESVYKVAPEMLQLFPAPYGTDLCWMYEGGMHTGYVDLNTGRDVAMQDILRG